MEISPLFCVYLLEDAFLIKFIFLQKYFYVFCAICKFFYKRISMESFTPIFIIEPSDFKNPNKKEDISIFP